MERSRRDLVWVPILAVLVAFAVPWPLWGVDRVVAGLPVWIWWHVAWLGLCTVLFTRFVRSGAWERGMGVRSEASNGRSDEAAADEGAPISGGDRR